jgi:hypothetical protein
MLLLFVIYIYTVYIYIATHLYMIIYDPLSIIPIIKWTFIVNLPVKNGGGSQFCVCLPEGTHY